MNKRTDQQKEQTGNGINRRMKGRRYRPLKKSGFCSDEISEDSDQQNESFLT